MSNCFKKFLLLHRVIVLLKFLANSHFVVRGLLGGDQREVDNGLCIFMMLNII